MSTKYNVAVVGATGAVGEEVISILEERKFPVKNLIPLASARSADKTVEFNGEEYKVFPLIPESFEEADIAIFCTGGSVSEKYAPYAEQHKTWVIDNSSFFRMHDDVPLVIPEINPDDLNKATERKLVANPNCTTAIMLMGLYAIHKEKKIERIIISSYQSVSGGGKDAMLELEEQIRQIYAGETIEPKVIAHQIAFNVVPHIDSFAEGESFSGEEKKISQEVKKILGDSSIAVAATAVRVPVFIGHGESVYVETAESFDIDELRSIISASEGAVLVDDPQRKLYPMPIHAAGQEEVLVGRLRLDPDISNGFHCFIAGDNLRKGAAQNAVQIAEKIIEMDLI